MTIVILAVGLALVVLPAAAALALNVLNHLTRQINQAVRGDAQPAAVAPVLSLNQVARWPGAERVNILLLGIDQRPNEDPDTARTDTMILLSVDPQTGTAGMMSIPRDLFVPLPNRGQDRINTAHARGGPEFAMQTVEYNFGIPVNHFVRVNFNALVKLVDLVGGVDIYVSQDINDQTFPDNHYGYDPFVIRAGWHRMDGATALKYARTRHGSSDFERMRRQQQVIMALRDAVLSTDAVTKVLPNAPQILATLQDSIRSDLDPLSIAQLVMLAKDIPAEKIARVVIDETAVQAWTTPQGASVLIPIRDRLRELREQLYNPPPAQAANALPETERAAARIGVFNGTPMRGLAASAKAHLESRGFTGAQIGNADGDYPRTIIIDYKGRPALSAQLAAELGLPVTAIVTQPDTTQALDLLVILGQDFQAPAAAPPQP
ncbi:MAG: LCP family protein [Anaerolineae bacterium]|nr:LCP family protein [Thermoflexales bacterium]MDW8408183.1 LCP family protein [Anaerolineae bacterium]